MAEPHNFDQDRAFEMLERYLERLQRGEIPDRKKLLEEHPELAPALKCLDALESMAPAFADTMDGESGGAAGPAKHDAVSYPQGRVFGDYLLLDEIGRGGMGVVYKARQLSLDRIVAVKMIDSLSASRQQIERFQAEAKAAAAINHPHVVQIYEVGEDFGRHYFAMEFVAGSTLAKRLEAERHDPTVGRMSEDEAAGLVAAVAHAVDHLHRHNIVHRDLKPSNILLDQEGKPKVTDFGLAKSTGPGSRDGVNGVIAGTAQYMSPEQARGQVDAVGPASDVYSLGTILYELLTGRPPFRGDNPMDVLMQQREREPLLPRQINHRISRELEIVCLKCLEKSPTERYHSASALGDDLDRFLRRETIEATPPSLAQQVWRWARREPALATRLGAFSLFWLVLAFLFGYVQIQLADKWKFFWEVTLVLGIWLTASLVFQRLLTRRRWEATARYLWGFVDTLLLSAVLILGDGLASPMVVGLPLLIVAAGLWSQVRFIWFVTACCVVAYGGLMTKYYVYDAGMSLRPFDPQLDRHIYFLISLILCGCMVAYQVSRTRALTRYFERRRAG